jgi:predicted RNA-binding protein associated with RNAse of E/G family
MERVQVWLGRYGDPVPLDGPYPGFRDGNVVVYEFGLPERFQPRPGRLPVQRVFMLADLGVSMAQPYWMRLVRDDGTVTLGIDAADGESTTWYVDLLEVDDRGDEIIARDLYIDVMVPMDGRHQRILDLDEYADAIEQGIVPIEVAVDGLRRWQRFLDDHLHRDRDPRAAWTDFPPKAIKPLAALPTPLAPVVTWHG